MFGASWSMCLGRAGTSVRGELVQVFGASWSKCLGQAGMVIAPITHHVYILNPRFDSVSIGLDS